MADRLTVNARRYGFLQPAPLAWSASAGPAEGHLRLRHDNLLFPPHKRIIVQADIDGAREQDDAALAALVATFLATEQKQLAMPGAALADVQAMLKQYDDLNAGFLMHGSPDAMRWQGLIASHTAPLIKAMHVAGQENFTVRRTFNAWREAERERNEQHRNPAFLTIGAAPPEDFASTVCSLEPQGIAFILRRVDVDKSVGDIVRAECVRLLAQAVQEGFPVEIAAARLTALECSVH